MLDLTGDKVEMRIRLCTPDYLASVEQICGKNSSQPAPEVRPPGLLMNYKPII